MEFIVDKSMPSVKGSSLQWFLLRQYSQILLGCCKIDFIIYTLQRAISSCYGVQFNLWLYHSTTTQVPMGDIYEASRAGDIERLKLLLDEGINVNARDNWDSVALYYACLAGHLDAARILLEKGAICSENTFDGDRCHYASLNLSVRRLLKAFEARPPPLDPLPRSFRELFVCFGPNFRYPHLKMSKVLSLGPW